MKLDPVYRGADYGPITINVRAADGTAVDLTSWTVQSRMRARTGYTTDLEPEITDAANGVIEIYPRAADTVDWPLGTHTWDIVLTNPDGAVLPYLANEPITVARLSSIPETVAEEE